MFGIDTQDLQDLKIVDVKVGTGAEAKPGELVRVHYTGWLEDGIIQGWDRGVAGMKVGGVRRLFIPSQLAYGDGGAGSVIPPNATLIFEIQLLGVKDNGKWQLEEDVITPVSAPDVK